MAARGVYESRTHFYLSRFAGRVLIVKGFVAKYIITCSWLWREGLEIFCPNKNYILSHKSSVFYHTLCPNIFQFHHQSFHITTNVTFETKIIVQIWINLWNVEWHLRLKYYADALYLLLLLKRAAIKSHANPARVTKELRLAGPAFLTYSLLTLSPKIVTFFFQPNHHCHFFLWIPLFFITFLFQVTLVKIKYYQSLTFLQNNIWNFFRFPSPIVSPNNTGT